jgi:hypothetical protein
LIVILAPGLVCEARVFAAVIHDKHEFDTSLQILDAGYVRAGMTESMGYGLALTIGDGLRSMVWFFRRFMVDCRWSVPVYN